jgi:hypothetical protein
MPRTKSRRQELTEPQAIEVGEDAPGPAGVERTEEDEEASPHSEPEEDPGKAEAKEESAHDGGPGAQEEGERDLPELKTQPHQDRLVELLVAGPFDHRSLRPPDGGRGRILQIDRRIQAPRPNPRNRSRFWRTPPP